MMILGLILVILLLLGAPLFAVIGAAAFFNFYQADIDLQAIAIEFYGIAEMPILLAIPLFTFAGYLLSESDAPKRIVRLTSALLGWMPAGLAIAGYPEKFNLGLVTSAGSLGLLFAPSLPLILYGVVAEVPIEQLFLAGLIPGFLMLLVLSAYSVWKNRAIRTPLGDFSWQEVRAALRESIWEIPLPIVVLGGIYSGYFAISEAAAVTALYVLIVDMLILKEVSVRKLPAIVRESMVLVGGIMMILGVSRASTNFMIDAGVPQQLLQWISGFVTGELAFMVMLLVFLLILGAILDIFSAVVLVVPLILPVATQFGVHPVHLGIVFLSTMQLGYITPPVGLNLFIAGYRFDRPIVNVYLSTLPFFFLLLLSVILIAFWPALSLWLLG